MPRQTEFKQTLCADINANRAARSRALVVPQEPEAPAQSVGASPWPGAARGLRPPNRDTSGDPPTRAAGVGCVRVVAGPMQAARRQGVTHRRRHGAAHFGFAINAQQLASRSQPASKVRFKHVGRCVPPLFCRVLGAVGKEQGRFKSLSPLTTCI